MLSLILKRRPAHYNSFRYRRVHFLLSVMRYALCVMRYALCVMRYALCVMRYALSYRHIHGMRYVFQR